MPTLVGVRCIRTKWISLGMGTKPWSPLQSGAWPRWRMVDNPSKSLPYLWLPSAVRSCSEQLHTPVRPQTRSWSRSPGTHQWPWWSSWCWVGMCGSRSSVWSWTTRLSLLGKQAGAVPCAVLTHPITLYHLAGWLHSGGHKIRTGLTNIQIYFKEAMTFWNTVVLFISNRCKWHSFLNRSSSVFF